MEHLSQFIMNHWELWLALVTILLVIFVNELLSQKTRAKDISPQAAVDLMNHEDAVVIDLRDKASYMKGHIINAMHAELSDFEQKNMDKYKSKPLILVCYKGIQAPGMATKLKGLGFTQLSVLNGGMAGWEGANMPVVKGKR